MKARMMPSLLASLISVSYPTWQQNKASRALHEGKNCGESTLSKRINLCVAPAMHADWESSDCRLHFAAELEPSCATIVCVHLTLSPLHGTNSNNMPACFTGTFNIIITGQYPFPPTAWGFALSCWFQAAVWSLQ